MSISDIVNRLSESDRVFVAETMAELDRKLELMRRQDAVVVEGLARSLTAPHHGDDVRRAVLKIEKFIRDIVKQELEKNA